MMQIIVFQLYRKWQSLTAMNIFYGCKSYFTLWSRSNYQPWYKIYSFWGSESTFKIYFAEWVFINKGVSITFSINNKKTITKLRLCFFKGIFITVSSWVLLVNVSCSFIARLSNWDLSGMGDWSVYDKNMCKLCGKASSFKWNTNVFSVLTSVSTRYETNRIVSSKNKK